MARPQLPALLDNEIKPQYALERLDHQIKDEIHTITSEVGQHQTWAAVLKLDEPSLRITFGGLGTDGLWFSFRYWRAEGASDALVIAVAARPRPG